MKQSDAVKFLYRDLEIVSSDLVLKDYDQVFEEEMQEFFPFNETIMDWLVKLYASEKYASFDEHKLSLYYEKDHPFLFIRDLAHINSWNLGHTSVERRDHITGLMFSGTPQYAMEATFAMCRPSRIGEPVSQWFDFKQAMNNAELAPLSDVSAQAWKAGAMFFLYFHLSGDAQNINRDELVELMEPYRETVDIAMHEGDQRLRQELGRITRMLRGDNTQEMLDRFHV